MDITRIMRHSGWICWKDLLEFGRSKMRLVMLILMPLFMMVMVGFIFPTEDSIKDTPIVIANQDEGSANGSLGDAFVMQLEAMNEKTHMMKITYADDFDGIKTKIRNGDVDGGIVIAPDFTESIEAGRQGNITIITDQSNPQTSMTISAVLSRVIDEMGNMKAAQDINASYNISINQSSAMVKPYKVDSRGIVPGKPNYFQFVAPGIMAMVVMMSLMTGLPHAISYEKDKGTLDGMLIAPINRFSIIFGKVMAQTIRGMVQGFIILALAILIFGVTIEGSILLVLILILLTVYSFVGLGILITSFTDKEETATMVMMTLMFPMMFMSGVFFPIQQMPWFMQLIAQAFPLTYASQALRKVVVLGADVSSLTTEIMVLVAFGTFFLAIAVPMFKRAMNR